MVSFKAGTQTQSDVTVVAVITCLSAFLLAVFVGVVAADLALAGRTQFLFNRRDLLQEMTSTITVASLSLSLTLSHSSLYYRPLIRRALTLNQNQTIHSPYCSKV